MNTEWFGGVWQLHAWLAREEVFDFAEALAMDVVSPVGYYGPWVDISLRSGWVSVEALGM